MIFGMKIRRLANDAAVAATAACTFLPVLNGIYLYLIICLICRRMVINNNTIQYRRRIGQNTGMSKMGNKVMVVPIKMAFMQLSLHEDAKLTYITYCCYVALNTSAKHVGTMLHLLTRT